MLPRGQLAVAIGAQAACVILQQWLVTAGRVGLFGAASVPLIHTVAVGFAVSLSGAVAWAVLRGAAHSATVGVVLLVLGGLSALWWPVAFWLGLPSPDVVASWATGPALPIWQGLFVAVLGIYSLGASVLQKRQRRIGEWSVEDSHHDAAEATHGT